MKDDKDNKLYFKVHKDKEITNFMQPNNIILPKPKAYFLDDNKLFSYNDRMIIRKFSFVLLIDYCHKLAEEYLHKTNKESFLNSTSEDFTDYTFVDIKNYLNKNLIDIFITDPSSEDEIDKVYHNLLTINTSNNKEFKSLMHMKIKDIHNLFIKSERISSLLNKEEMKVGNLLAEQFVEISKNLIRYYDP